MPVFDQEQYRPQMHEALAALSETVFDTPEFASASFRFRDPVGPGENREVSMRPVRVGADSFWQVVRAGEAENLGRGRAKKFLWDLANSANVLLEAHASETGGGAIHLRATKKGRVLVQRVKGRGAASGAAATEKVPAQSGIF